MKEYSVRVSISAGNESDLIERIEDLKENPINSFIEQSIEVNGG